MNNINNQPRYNPYKFKNSAVFKLYVGIIFLIGMVTPSLLILINHTIFIPLMLPMLIVSFIGGFIIMNIYCHFIYPNMTIRQYIWYQNLKRVTYQIMFRKYPIYDIKTNSNNICVLARIDDENSATKLAQLQPYLNKIQNCAYQIPNQYTTIQIFAGHYHDTDETTESPIAAEPIQ